MWFLDLIIKQFGLVILNFNTNSANLYLILHNIGIYIECCHNGRTSTKSNLVTLDLWSWCFTLNVYTSCLARHDDIFRNDHIILRLLINHNRTRTEMCKRAFMNCGVTFKGQNTRSKWTSSLIIFIILKRVTFEVAMENLDTCIRHSNDAWYFSMSFLCTSV